MMQSDIGEIQFFFDPAQIKNFLYELDNTEAASRVGNSLLFESRVIRTIENIIEPLSLLFSIAGGFMWLNWWGMLTAIGVLIFWWWLKSSSSMGKQYIIIPLTISLLGFFIIFLFQQEGAGFIVFGVSITLLHCAVKMLYALPGLFLSKVVGSNYRLFNILYENHIDNFNRKMNYPMMWYVEK